MAALVKKLKSVMEKRCDQAETVIAFEVAAAAHYLVDRMTLNDPSCKAVRNRTHWVLKTQRYAKWDLKLLNIKMFLAFCEEFNQKTYSLG